MTSRQALESSRFVENKGAFQVVVDCRCDNAVGLKLKSRSLDDQFRSLAEAFYWPHRQAAAGSVYSAMAYYVKLVVAMQARHLPQVCTGMQAAVQDMP